MSSFTFFAFPPSAVLEPFVECIWGVRGTAFYHVESVLPNGSMELMVNFGPPQRVLQYGDKAVVETFDRAWLAGIQDQRLVHASEWGADHISVRFKPGGARAFFRLPMDELTNQVVRLDDLMVGTAGGLRDRLLAQPDDRGRSLAMEAWLIEQMGPVDPDFVLVRRAADLLRDGDRRMRVSEVCSRLGLSNRHLIQQFRNTLGLAPKTYARIERFAKVVADCRGRDRVVWSRMAVRHGYADQPHLIREFRRFAGVTPRQFLARRTPDESNVIVE